MSTRWVLGQVRFGEALAAAGLTILASLVAFAVFAFLIRLPDIVLVSPADIMFALVGLLAAVPLRCRGASMASVLVGVAVTTALEILLAWLSASEGIRALAAPGPFQFVIPVAAATFGVLVAFHVVRAAPADRRWNRMALW